MRSHQRRIVAIVVCLFTTFAIACQKSSPSAVNNSSPAHATTAVTEQTPDRISQPVSVADLQAVLTRTYKDAVVLDTSRSETFVAGDFNGDNSEDIAIVVKPRNDKLAELNSEYANWILEDAVGVGKRVEQMSEHQLPERSGPERVWARDVLLAVIHGYQEAGWRDPKASQTYLLKNAIGDEMRTEQARARGSAAPKDRLPRLRGDLIRETRAGAPGFIYWTGAKYAWHSESATQ